MSCQEAAPRFPRIKLVWVRDAPRKSAEIRNPSNGYEFTVARCCSLLFGRNHGPIDWEETGRKCRAIAQSPPAARCRKRLVSGASSHRPFRPAHIHHLGRSLRAIGRREPRVTPRFLACLLNARRVFIQTEPRPPARSATWLPRVDFNLRDHRPEQCTCAALRRSGSSGSANRFVSASGPTSAQKPRHDHDVDIFLQRRGGKRLMHRAEDFQNRMHPLLARAFLSRRICDSERSM